MSKWRENNVSLKTKLASFWRTMLWSKFAVSCVHLTHPRCRDAAGVPSAMGLVPTCSGSSQGLGFIHHFTSLRIFTKTTQWLFALTYLVLSTGHVLIEISSIHKKLNESLDENVCELFLYLPNILIFKFYFTSSLKPGLNFSFPCVHSSENSIRRLSMSWRRRQSLM